MAQATVKYTGPTVHRRIFSKKDLKDVGVDQDIVLDRSNKHEVTLELSDEAVALLEAQPNVKVTKAEAKTETPSNQQKPAAR